MSSSKNKKSNFSDFRLPTCPKFRSPIEYPGFYCPEITPPKKMESPKFYCPKFSSSKVNYPKIEIPTSIIIRPKIDCSIFGNHNSKFRYNNEESVWKNIKKQI